MRRLVAVGWALFALLAASLASPVAASASGQIHPVPTHLPWHLGSQTGATPFTAPSGGIRSPASVAPAPVPCDGKFDVVASPNGTGNNYLISTSAVNANDVWAVGNSTTAGGFDRTLAEHWNGTSWTVVATPNPPAFFDDLTGVSAISTNDVWAVGTYSTDIHANTASTFAEHWDGISWTLIPTVNPSTVSILLAVTAVSSGNVWAVGTYIDFTFNVIKTLIEHWNGSSWSQVGGTNPSFDNELVAVSAWSATDIWAVGLRRSSGVAPLQSLALHFDGSNWTTITTPNLGAGAWNEILGVNALEAGHAVGVGFGNFVTGSTPRKGEAWNLLASGPSTSANEIGPGAGDNALLAVARSGGSVWAVGYWRNTAMSPRQTLVIPAAWDSTGHTLTWGPTGTSASPSSINQALFGVDAISPHAFWATGYANNGAVDQTLTELYCDLHFNLVAPGTATVGLPFALTVTATNADASTATGYGGTVHFTSSDLQAVLPPDYTFIPADSGTHTFSGVVLKTPHNQTITASDLVTFVTGSVTIKVVCSGACPAPAGTPGARGAAPGPAGSAGARGGANQSPSGSPGPRLPRHLAIFGGPPGDSAHQANATASIKTRIVFQASNKTRIGVRAKPMQTTNWSALAPGGNRVLVARAGDQVLVFQRTIGSTKADESPWNVGLVSLLGLLVFVLALRRRKKEERSRESSVRP